MTTARLNRDHNFWVTEAIQPLDLGLGRALDPIACRASGVTGTPPRDRREAARGAWAREEGTGNAGAAEPPGLRRPGRMKDSAHRSG
ncbi:hypothetical protein GCM10010231_44520 [Streptomyces sindenensis]|nr:hypothetical protein GCM10010231_44520 [Streptomyces sindenensis]